VADHPPLPTDQQPTGTRTRFEVTFRNAVNGRTISACYDDLEEAERAAATERPFNNTATEVHPVPPSGAADAACDERPEAYTDYEGRRVIVHYRDGRTAHRFSLINLTTSAPVLSPTPPPGDIASITVEALDGSAELPVNLLLWDDVDPMIAWVYAQAPSTVKSWHYGKEYVFRHPVEPPVEPGFPRYDLKSPTYWLDRPWRIVDRECLQPPPRPEIPFTSEETARAEMARMNTLQRLRAYGVPAPYPRTVLREVVAQATDQTLRRSGTGEALALTRQQIGAVLRDHAAAAYLAGLSPHALEWQGVTITFATGLRFAPADAAYDTPNHWSACRASGFGYGAELTADGARLRLPLQTPRQTDYLAREVYSAIAKTLRPCGDATATYILRHQSGAPFHLDEDRAVAYVLDWRGIVRGDLADHDGVHLIDNFGRESTLAAARFDRTSNQAESGRL
jgi:hypothetical protein